VNSGEGRVSREGMAVVTEADDRQRFGNTPAKAVGGKNGQHTGDIVDSKGRCRPQALERGRNRVHIGMVGQGGQAQIVPGADQVTGSEYRWRVFRRDPCCGEGGAKAMLTFLHRRNVVALPAHHHHPAMPQTE